MKGVSVFLLLVLVTHGWSRNIKKESEIRDLLEELLDENVDQKRIIGGSDIETGDWPWLVLLTGRVGSITVRCGGSLISDQWILSAAHCFTNARLHGKDRNPPNWESRMGDKDLKASLWITLKGYLGMLFDKSDWKNFEIDVDEIIIHPEYEGAGNLWLHDIALIKLAESVPSSADSVSRVQAVALPDPSLKDSDWPPDKDMCMMKGWGCTEKGGKVVATAKDVDLPKVSDDECAWLWGIQAIYRLCAGYNYNDKGFCLGDSGGPLVCKDGDKWVQAGIASFTSRDYPQNFPGAFTRVTHYVDWIYETMKRNKAK